MIRKFLGLAMLLAFAGLAQAESVTIANASFEEPAQGAGGWTNTLPSWDGPADAGKSFIEYINGFVSQGVNHLGMESGAEVSQNLGVAALPSTTYQLTVGVGNRNASFSVPGNKSVYGLYVGGDKESGGSLLAEGIFDASTLAASTYADQTLTYTTGAVVPAGNLYLSLRSDGAGRAHFDNVRLSTVPEPAGLTLAALSLLGLSQIRRRRA